jgi:hypothetical protein
MAVAGPPSTPLFVHAKGVDADLGRHDGGGTAGESISMPVGMTNALRIVS